jgi:erythromycin esterase-like protein
MPKATLSRQLETMAHPLTGAPADYEPLFALIGNARFVLLGAASHGTHEFYRERAQILVVLRDGDAAIASLRHPWLERAIGVIYRPETEHLSHCVSVRLPEQFDAVLHFDETRAVEPLERTAAWERGAAPETFPSGL